MKGLARETKCIAGGPCMVFLTYTTGGTFDVSASHSTIRNYSIDFAWVVIYHLDEQLGSLKEWTANCQIKFTNNIILSYNCLHSTQHAKLHCASSMKLNKMIYC